LQRLHRDSIGRSGTYHFIIPSICAELDCRRSESSASVIVIEDKGSGTQLIQELKYEGVYNIQSYQPGPNQDKAAMYNNCIIIENGCVYLPEKPTG